MNFLVKKWVISKPIWRLLLWNEWINYVRQLESEPFADLILSHPVMARK